MKGIANIKDIIQPELLPVMRDRSGFKLLMAVDLGFLSIAAERDPRLSHGHQLLILVLVQRGGPRRVNARW